jgi:hypothetical protein
MQVATKGRPVGAFTRLYFVGYHPQITSLNNDVYGYVDGAYYKM